jgi:hypothetical protein
MCIGGGSSSNTAEQTYLTEQQMEQSAAASAASLAEQQREFDISEQNRQTDLTSTAEQEAKTQALTDQQAALTEQWQTGRSAEANQATSDISNAFAKFTPDYYNQYAQQYEQAYDPEVERQYGVAKQNLGYGLARTGNEQSQTAATQQALLAQEKGRNLTDVANKAVDAANTLQSNVEQSKSSLLSTALSDATLGSPVTPGSADAITSEFNTAANTLTQIKQNAGDVVNTLSAVPTYNALGNLFGSAASGVASYVSGSQTGLFNQGYGASSPTASSPSSSSSYRVT